MKRPRRSLPSVPPVIWRELESGKLLKEVSNMFGIDRRTLGYRLSKIDKDRYRRIVKQRPHKLHFGSLEAKRQGAESLFELNVRELLAISGVNFEFHAKLRLDRHLYKPDFLLRSGNVILEVAGITIRGYWKHLREKSKRYIKHGYILFVIVPGTSLYKKAEHYLLKNDRIRIVKYSEFRDNASDYNVRANDWFNS
jgi:predicted nuclease of restriction endonuclease-like RecB superfamily